MIAALALALLAAGDPGDLDCETSTVTWHLLSNVHICQTAQFVDGAQRGWAKCRRSLGSCMVDLRAKENDLIAAESAREYAERDADECDLALAGVETASTSPANGGLDLRVGIGPDTWIGVAAGIAAGVLGGILLGFQLDDD